MGINFSGKWTEADRGVTWGRKSGGTVKGGRKRERDGDGLKMEMRDGERDGRARDSGYYQGRFTLQSLDYCTSDRYSMHRVRFSDGY